MPCSAAKRFCALFFSLFFFFLSLFFFLFYVTIEVAVIRLLLGFTLNLENCESTSNIRDCFLHNIFCFSLTAYCVRCIVMDLSQL